MSIYIITVREFGVAKIGYSNNPRRRAATLSTANFAQTRLEAVIPGDRDCEAQLHEKFSGEKQRGEWFRICDGIENLITLFPIGRKPRKSKAGRAFSNFVDGILAKFPSQHRLSLETGISTKTISDWKRGKPNIPYWRRGRVLSAADRLGIELTQAQREYLEFSPEIMAA